MLKAAGDAGSEWVMDVCNAVVKEKRIPEDWKKSSMVNGFTGNGDALECIKFIEDVMKIPERVVESRVRKMWRSMRFNFV